MEEISGLLCFEERNCKYGEHIAEKAGEDCAGAVGFWYVVATLPAAYNSRWCLQLVR
jgi:hypothetical protein